MNNSKQTYNYTYSASEQKEIEIIRKKYVTDTISSEEDKMIQLRKLDSHTTNKASITALCTGIISALIMGFGMSLIMTDIGAKIGMTSAFIPGIVIGVIGMIGVIFAYPLYQYILKRERKKIAPQILKLTEELMK